MLRFVLNRDVKLRKESIELDEAIDFRKAHQEIMAYAKKSGGIDKTDFEKVAYYVKAIGDNQNTPNVANKAFMAMKKFVGDMDTDPRDGVMLMLKKHGMMKNGRLVQESITEGALGKQWVNGAKRVKSGSITLVKAKFAYDLHTVMKNGKKVGTFVFDDGPDAFSVTNMSTKKVSWADQIDDIPKMFESVELDEAIDFRKAHQEIMAYAKKSGGIDKTDFEKVAYYVKAIGDNQNSPNVANKAFMAMKKFVGDMDTDPRDGVMLMLKKHGMVKNGRMVQESVELDEQDVKVPLELLKLYNKGMALPAGSIAHKKVMKQIDDMRKKLGMKESVDEASKEGTVRIIDLGNKGQDKIRKELGVDKLPNKGFQVQVMTKGKFVNQGKPYKTMKDAEKVRSTGQHSMQFDEAKAPALKSSDYPKGTSMSAQAFKDRFAKKKKAPALKSSDYPKGTSMSATAWKKKHESVEEATLEEKTKWKMGDGRPRNGPRIENDRFWNLPYDSLKYIAKDAGEAMKANPTARKATTGPGNWADQVADAATVMQWRKKNGIKESKKFSDLR